LLKNSIEKLSQNVLFLLRKPSITPRGPAPEIPKDDLPETADERTIEAMLDNLRRLVSYEEQRLQSLTTRGSGLAGFAGLATAVISIGEVNSLPLAGRILLAAAAGGLVAAAAGVVLGMLTARGGTIQSTRQLALYRETAYQAVSPARVNLQIIDILITRLEGLREQNAVRAMWLNRSALVLVVSVLLAATAAVVRLFT
jgi:hypothetical protein